MALHADHIHSMFDGERKGIPILSVLGVLNDDYEGGEFYLIDEKTDLSKGDIIIFPSNFMYPHKVEPVTKGIRYSYISWIW
jgi:predicted 2-oxoglutarate/Fe(II)-dependent dioxygenase YbiX